MAKKKKITNAAAGLSKAQIAESVEKFAHAKARHDHITAKMNKELDSVRDRYAEQLEAHAQTMLEQQAVCEAWSKANREKQFGKRQSVEFTHGTLVFRQGNIRVKLPSKTSEAEVINRLAGIDGGDKYVRIPAPELNREGLLADRKIIRQDILEATGIQFAQSERFYVEPRLDDPVPAGGN